MGIFEPTKKIEVIEVEYWSCYNPNHRHKTYDVACRCAGKIQDIELVRCNTKAEKQQGIEIARRLFNGARMDVVCKELGVAEKRAVWQLRSVMRKALELHPQLSQLWSLFWPTTINQAIANSQDWLNIINVWENDLIEKGEL